MLKPNHFALYALIATCCAIELALVLSDRAVIVPLHVRQLAYDYGAFWPGLLGNWKPNYAAQPYTMFLTYSFLHGGIVHLVVNMISLWSLGNAVLNRVGQVRFVLLYFGSSLGGSAVFAMLAPTLRPMVGASGSLFGLLGAIVAWDYLDRYSNLEGLRDAARVVAILVGLNLVLWWAMDGQLAWQTHLGGFLAGWVVALLIKRKPLEDC
ncbi:rhomboid family intramembrane serine protease [uncultured Marivita sp.]|uniref:rhomboid family intramembrane serine protease n=1 Tax=uncultured Marivita sp. TaxID=888080 RepID=UPI00262B21CE|nr:rhomboid family intramembrane serine protease [uncultured Marivita sp.]